MFGNFSKKAKKSKKILQFKKKDAIIMYDCIFMCIFRRMNLAFMIIDAVCLVGKKG